MVIKDSTSKLILDSSKIQFISSVSNIDDEYYTMTIKLSDGSSYHLEYDNKKELVKHYQNLKIKLVKRGFLEFPVKNLDENNTQKFILVKKENISFFLESYDEKRDEEVIEVLINGFWYNVTIPEKVQDFYEELKAK